MKMSQTSLLATLRQVAGAVGLVMPYVSLATGLVMALIFGGGGTTLTRLTDFALPVVAAWVLASTVVCLVATLGARPVVIVNAASLVSWAGLAFGFWQETGSLPTRVATGIDLSLVLAFWYWPVLAFLDIVGWLLSDHLQGFAGGEYSP